ncbi:hypothetical protein N0V90_004404 [Kalmusia sp. IMI 367209]|nr:hypothetical protein N0V90_004404 [Kalmusia sp. IMI 367209]
MYDASVVASDGEKDHHPALEVRRRRGRSRSRKGSISKTTKKGTKKTPENSKTTKPKTTKPKTTKPKTTKPKTTKPKTTKPKTKKVKSCPLPKKKGQKGKGKKTVRDLVEDYLPKVLSSVILPRTPVGSRPGSSAGSRPGSPQGSDSDGCNNAWFQRHELQRSKVEWFSFHTEEDGWESVLNPSHKARKILGHMPRHSKFDAVKLHRGNMQVVGYPTTSSLPEEWPKGTDSYLLTNGGFFDMQKKLEDDKPIGPTSLRPDYVPIPDVYMEYYKELRDGDQFLWAGPSLKTILPLHEKQFVYGNYPVPGSLNHAGSSNERLAVAFVGQDKYVFTHMGNDRTSNGVDVNKLRALIDEFLKAYGGAGASVSHASTVLNLDGGGSIWMSWRERGVEEYIIARGNGQDEGPPFGSSANFAGRAREVVNFLKWTAG